MHSHASSRLPVIARARGFLLFLAGAIAAFALCVVAGATSFTITAGSADTVAKVLATGDTGTIAATGSLTVSGGTNAVTVTGTASLDNAGTLSQAGSGRAVDLNTNSATLTLTNQVGGSILAVSTDAIRVNQANAGISLLNFGTIAVSNGGQALDLRAITTGANSVNNAATGVISALGEDAIRPGVNGSVTNAGQITATPVVNGSGAVTGSDGIDLGGNTGVSVTNTGTISGRHGITGGADVFALTIDNQSGGVIAAVNGSGVNIDGVTATAITTVTNAAGATIKGGVLAGATNGDGDGVDVDGILHLVNSGDILGLGAKGLGSDGLPNNAEAVSIGGGTLVNHATGRIIGSTLPGDAANGDASRGGNGILADDSSGGGAPGATTLLNEGWIEGKTGYAVKFVGAQSDSLTNSAGATIRSGKPAGAPEFPATIDLGGGDDVLSNAGSIISGGGAAATAIALGAGNDQATVIGGSAMVTGAIDGGSDHDSLRFDLGAGGHFNQDGAITGFEQVDLVSGATRLGGSLDLGAADHLLTVAGGATLEIGDVPLGLENGSLLVDGTLRFVLNDPSDLSRLVLGGANAGSVTLGASSQLELVLGFAPVHGQEFTLLDLLGGNNPFSGTFAGLAEGARFSAGGHDFQISYAGNGGHDVVVRAVPDSGPVAATFAGGLVLLAFFRRRWFRR